MEEKQTSINSLKVNFKVTGEGPVVLILHGWGSSSDSWVEVQQILAGEGFKVVCPDFPGFGKSETPKKPWGVSDYVEWTTSFIRSQNMDSFFLLSHSFGGRIAIKMAAEHQKEIRAMVLCSAAGLKHKPDFKTQIIFILSKIGSILLAPRIMRRVKDTARNVFYLFFRHRDYVKAPINMRETMKKVVAEDLLPYLSSISTKTLVVWGRRDKILPVDDAYIIEKEINGAQLEIMKAADHSPHLQMPEELSGLVIKFFKTSV